MVFCMAGLVIITLLNVVTRYLTDDSFAWTEEFSVALMVVMTLAGASAVAFRDRHIRIEFFFNRKGADGVEAPRPGLQRGGSGTCPAPSSCCWRCCSPGWSGIRSDMTRLRWVWVFRYGGIPRSSRRFAWSLPGAVLHACASFRARLDCRSPADLVYRADVARCSHRGVHGRFRFALHHLGKLRCAMVWAFGGSAEFLFGDREIPAAGFADVCAGRLDFRSFRRGAAYGQFCDCLRRQGAGHVAYSRNIGGDGTRRHLRFRASQCRGGRERDDCRHVAGRLPGEFFCNGGRGRGRDRYSDSTQHRVCHLQRTGSRCERAGNVRRRHDSRRIGGYCVDPAGHRPFTSTRLWRCRARIAQAAFLEKFARSILGIGGAGIDLGRHAIWAGSPRPKRR